ncbi:SMI1/KNR4 family protein [Planobispora takensis]|uniref:Knr4/Smi1-like domain-containing protein n=1 Tax=Planobispora takensis TaxID=1367882 RepID=A0A8J3SSR9_9ACTN|nr:SMI1/KNR4 family protein [Planobispora takensis]GIH99592.1 hypothetical protein Pta02_16010 [Planobispora takensis]
MRRLIDSRGVRLALAAVVAAAVIAAVCLRLRRAQDPARRSDAVSDPVRQDGVIAETAVRAESDLVSGPVSPWPPVPILGVPAPEDLRRYAGGPSAFRSGVEDFFGRPPREPLDDATRRRLNRWGAAGLALLLLAGGAQLVESAVFSKDPEPVTEIEVLTWHSREASGETCTENPLNGTASCVREEPGLSDEGFSQFAQDWQRPAPEGEKPEPIPDVGTIPDADCRPGTGAPRVRPISPEVTRAVNRQWRRIETWLRANAPRSHRTLGRPGSAEAIAEAEAGMGLRFPDALRASLLRHDGSVSAGDAWEFGFVGEVNLSTRQIHRTWRSLCEIDADDMVDGEYSDPRSEWWDGRMIPFSANGMGDHLVIDSAERDVGNTDHEGSIGFESVAGLRFRSYYALLKATADSLETGGALGYLKPEAVAGELEWEILDETTPPGGRTAPTTRP